MTKLMNVLTGVAAASLLLTSAACGAPKTKADAPIQIASVATDADAATTKAPRTHKPRSSRASAAFPTTVYTPAQAIEAAKNEDGAKGVFEFKVASVGGGSGKGRSIYLNSEADYHDAKNISVMVRPAAASDLEESLGGPLDKTMTGKRVAVTGTAKPVTTNIYDEDHNKTGQTFVQTRVIVAKADKIVMK